MKDVQQAQDDLQALFRAHGISPFNPLFAMAGAFLQMPLWATFFFTIQDIAGRDNGLLGWQHGGALWFPDLTVGDPYLGLPVLCGFSFYGLIALGDAGTAGSTPSDQQIMMRRFMKGFSVFMVPLTYWMHSGVFIYWITNNVLAMGQTVLLKTPSARAAFGMPPLPDGTSILPQLTSPKKPEPSGPFIPQQTFSSDPTKSQDAPRVPIKKGGKPGRRGRKK